MPARSEAVSDKGIVLYEQSAVIADANDLSGILSNFAGTALVNLAIGSPKKFRVNLRLEELPTAAPPPLP
jgi:hypothetical protein